MREAGFRRAPRGAAGDPGRAVRRAARRATPPASTTRSTRSAGPTPTATRAGCATASSPRPASGRCREDEAKERGRDYLQEEILARGESVVPHAWWSSPRTSDAVHDPTVAWPEERERVEVGRLELTGPETRARAGRRHPGVRPTRVTDGIELSATTRSCASARRLPRCRWRAGAARRRTASLGAGLSAPVNPRRRAAPARSRSSSVWPR